jgi:hypothetical protein
MMSNNRDDYASASEWLSALRKDELWLSQLQQLQDPAADVAALRATAMRKMGQGETLTLEFWDSYGHQVEPAVMEVWGICELTLAKLKMQAVGMLMMEWIEQHVKTAGAPSEKKKPAAKKKPEKPQKPRETMTFKKKNSISEGHLTMFHQKLTDLEWIDGIEGDFKALFSGKRDEACSITWLGKYGNGTLVELFRQLAAEGLVLVPPGYTLPHILEGHFKDQKGNWLTRLDKGDKANDQSLPVIRECVELLKMDVKQLLQKLRGAMEDDDEDFQSKYDPYDHQDLNIHKW